MNEKISSFLDYWESSEQLSSRKATSRPRASTSVSVADIKGKLASCCTEGSTFACVNTGCHAEHSVGYRVFSTCGISICENVPCLKSRVRRRRKKYLRLCSKFRTPKFLTLTLKGYHDLDIVVFRRIQYMWKVFSQWCRRKGYIWAYFKALELVPHDYIDVHGEPRTVYFYHFHVIYDGRRIPLDLLRDEWKSITGDSYIIGISEVNPFSYRSRFRVSGYVTKYVTKSAYLELEPDEYLPFRKTSFFYSWRHPSLFKMYESDDWERYRLLCPYCGIEMDFICHGPMVTPGPFAPH